MTTSPQNSQQDYNQYVTTRGHNNSTACSQQDDLHGNQALGTIFAQEKDCLGRHVKDVISATQRSTLQGYFSLLLQRNVKHEWPY